MCRGGFTGRSVVASITADIHRSSVHSQMMMINIRRIISANEMRFADESHSSKFKRKKIEAERKKKERREKKREPHTQEGAIGQRSSFNLMVLTKIH